MSDTNRTPEADRPAIVIIGPGAVGTVLAVLLARAGAPVSLAVRPGAMPHRCTLHLSDGASTTSAELAAAPLDAPVGARPYIVCVCVKAHDTAGVSQAAAALLASAAAVVSAQNGAENLEALAAVTDAPLVLAPPGFGAVRAASGTVMRHGTGLTQCAPFTAAAQPFAQAWATLLTKAGLPAAVVPSCPSVLWRKLIINAAVNPLTALHRVPNGAIAERPAWRDQVTAIVTEAAAVAAREGAELPPPDSLAADVLAVCRTTSANRSSMLQDVLAGRPTEIEQITGFITAAARRYGIATPVNTRLLQDIRALA